MSSSTSELDAFRAELLRQKIVFESELRRQRESMEDRLEILTKKMEERETENRSLRNSLTAMGKKVDQLQEQLIKQSGSVPRGRSESRANSPSVAGRHSSPVPSLRVPSPAPGDRYSRAPSLYSRAQSSTRPASPGATPRTTGHSTPRTTTGATTTASTSSARDSPAAQRPVLRKTSAGGKSSTATVPVVKRLAVSSTRQTTNGTK